jgi:hypothetical protein
MIITAAMNGKPGGFVSGKNREPKLHTRADMDY